MGVLNLIFVMRRIILDVPNHFITRVCNFKVGLFAGCCLLHSKFLITFKPQSFVQVLRFFLLCKILSYIFGFHYCFDVKYCTFDILTINFSLRNCD